MYKCWHYWLVEYFAEQKTRTAILHSELIGSEIPWFPQLYAMCFKSLYCFYAKHPVAMSRVLLGNEIKAVNVIKPYSIEPSLFGTFEHV